MKTCRCGCGLSVAKVYAIGHSRRRPLRERFMGKVDQSGECWIWLGALSSGGYGRIGSGVGNGTLQAHRVAYELFIGPIPDGYHIDHLCGVRRCVNPAHLEAVTQAENNRRAWRANRRTHCKRGHEYTPENVVRCRNGRNCRACRTRRARELRAARRNALLTGSRP